MPQVTYVVVCSDGTSYDLSKKDQFMEWGKTKQPRFDLQDLIAHGWVPVRETGMGGGDHAAFALVVLEK